MSNNSRSAYILAVLAMTHATEGNLDSIQFAIIQHFMEWDETGKVSTVDPETATKDINAAIELLELAAYMLRDRKYNCVEALQPKNTDPSRDKAA